MSAHGSPATVHRAGRSRRRGARRAALSATNDEFFADAREPAQAGPRRLPPGRVHRARQVDGRLGEPPQRGRAATTGASSSSARAGGVRGLDIDTNHFLGNHPPFASLEAIGSRRAARRSTRSLTRRGPSCCAQSPLRPGSQNLFAIARIAPRVHPRAPQHLSRRRRRAPPRVRRRRARLRGARRRRRDAGRCCRLGEVDLAAVQERRARARVQRHVLRPDEQPHRARAAPRTWAAAGRRGDGAGPATTGSSSGSPRAGTLGLVEIDTNHFKGNYPDRASLDGIDAARRAHHRSASRATAWRTVLARAEARRRTRRHFYRDELAGRGPVSHVRFACIPDGGVSRLRVVREDESA